MTFSSVFLLCGFRKLTALYRMKISFRTTICKFGNKGEKSGWRYIEISSTQAAKLKNGCKVSFRVKGTLDQLYIEKIAILPMGDGNFILPINQTIRKKLGKEEGDRLSVELTIDEREIKINSDFLKCVKDDEHAYEFFNSLPRSHQNYFSKWIETAKTSATKTKRITMAVIALGARQGYSEMIRANKGDKTQ